MTIANITDNEEENPENEAENDTGNETMTNEELFVEDMTVTNEIESNTIGLDEELELDEAELFNEDMTATDDG